MDGSDGGRSGCSSVVDGSGRYVGKWLESPPIAAKLEAPRLSRFREGRP